MAVLCLYCFSIVNTGGGVYNPAHTKPLHIARKGIGHIQPKLVEMEVRSCSCIHFTCTWHYTLAGVSLMLHYKWHCLALFLLVNTCLVEFKLTCTLW